MTDWNKTEAKSIIEDAFKAAGLDVSTEFQLSRQIDELDAKRPPMGECQLAFLRERWRLAMLLFMTNGKERLEVRKLVASLVLLDPVRVFTALYQTRGDKEEEAANIINKLCMGLADVVVGATTLVKLEEEHAHNECNCKAACTDPEWWCGAFPS